MPEVTNEVPPGPVAPKGMATGPGMDSLKSPEPASEILPQLEQVVHPAAVLVIHVAPLLVLT